MLRIVAGRFRGRRLHTVGGQHVRPTADRVKESLYDVLQAEVAEARVLDLFAGTGNLGLEALSRGARSAVFVERHAGALDVLRRNIRLLGVEAQVEVVAGDAVRYLASDRGARFDLLLADPPYDGGFEAPLLACLRPTLLSPGGWFVLQHDRRTRLGDVPAGYRVAITKRFGDTVLDFLTHSHPEDAKEEMHGGS